MPIEVIHRHPRMLTTPRNLANAIASVQGTSPVIRRSSSVCLSRRLRLSYQFRYSTSLSHLNADQRQVYTFFNSNKAVQRKILQAEGLPTIPCATTHEEARGLETPTGKYVVRPLNHQYGNGWRTTLLSTDFQEGREYIQPLLQKKREFRVLTSLGKQIVFLRKKLSGIYDPSVPWNHHQGSSFVTVNSERFFYPGYSFLDDALQHPILYYGDLIGVDILQDENNRSYIIEYNSAPAVTIESNLNKIAEYLVNHPRFN